MDKLKSLSRGSIIETEKIIGEIVCAKVKKRSKIYGILIRESVSPHKEEFKKYHVYGLGSFDDLKLEIAKGGYGEKIKIYL